MVAEMWRGIDLTSVVDHKRGTVDRRLFTDQQIYDLEMERIFARAWLFMAHESQIPHTGDYFLTTMGEDRVIVTRDETGTVQVLLNSCRHRGNAVCRAEEGNVSSFMCTYHGWTFGLDGKLVGVPGFKEVYHEELDRDAWGLIKAAKVERYKGFIFATMDPAAIPLDEYLGEVGRLGLDLLAEHGTNRVVGGIQKYTIGCNWKFAADNVWDWYHVGFSHASALRADYIFRRPAEGQPQPNDLTRNHTVMPGEYGHVVGGPIINERLEAETGINSTPALDESWRKRPEARQALGPVGILSRGHPHIFPNMWITGNQISMRFPKGPSATEIWWFTLLADEYTPEVREAQRHRANHTFGPAGMLEQDDGENWDQSTKGVGGVIGSRFPLNYGMGLHHGELIDDELSPPRIETQVNEHGQLWLYRSYREWMLAESWADLKANHSKPEGTL